MLFLFYMNMECTFFQRLATYVHIVSAQYLISKYTELCVRCDGDSGNRTRKATAVVLEQIWTKILDIISAVADIRYQAFHFDIRSLSYRNKLNIGYRKLICYQTSRYRINPRSDILLVRQQYICTYICAKIHILLCCTPPLSNAPLPLHITYTVC